MHNSTSVFMVTEIRLLSKMADVFYSKA